MAQSPEEIARLKVGFTEEVTEQSRAFDKAVTTLSAGALALSIAFVRDIAPDLEDPFRRSRRKRRPVPPAGSLPLPIWRSVRRRPLGPSLARVPSGRTGTCTNPPAADCLAAGGRHRPGRRHR